MKTTIYRDPAAAIPNMNERVITARFRNPSRSASIVVSNDPWTTITHDVPQQYAGLLHAVLEDTAKQQLSDYLSSFSTWPSEAPTDRFSMDSLIEAASSKASAWMTKDDLEQAWKQSTTRRSIMGDSRYASNPAYRKAADKFQELILKLAGKSASYTEDEMDKILAKLSDADLTSEMGSFIIRRIEQIRNKPTNATIDLDLL